MPFELLCACRPHGLLEVTKKPREEQPFPFRSVVEFVSDMQDKIKAVFSTMREHLSRAQGHGNDRRASPRELWLEDQVLLFVLDASCKFLT